MKDKLLYLLLSAVPLLPLNGFDIVRDGQAAASIHAPSDLPRRVSKAIECFRTDVKAMTGAEVKLRDGGKNRIEVILLKTGPYADNTAHVTFPAGNTMRIAGGVYALARIFPLLSERFGGVVRVYPGKDGTHYPEKKNFSIPEEPPAREDPARPAQVPVRCRDSESREPDRPAETSPYKD